MENTVKFSERQIAAWKRIAMNVNGDITRRDKLVAKRDELQKEINRLNRIIELNEMPVMESTNGYTTSEIFVKKVIESDKDGRPVKTTRYELRYPETIVPVVEVTNEECPMTDEQISAEYSSDVNNI